MITSLFVSLAHEVEKLAQNKKQRRKQQASDGGKGDEETRSLRTPRARRPKKKQYQCIASIRTSVKLIKSTAKRFSSVS